MPRTVAPRSKGPRAYVSDFHIALGPINSIGRLVPVRKNDSDGKFVGVCPDCNEPVKPDQRYICPNDVTHVHPMAELARAKEVDGALHFVSRDEIDAARASDLPLNVLRLTVHPREQVWDKVWDAGNAYVFQPRVVDEWFALLVRLVKDSGKTFIAMANVRNFEGLFRLDVWQDHIVVQKVVWPDECNAFDSSETDTADNDMYEAALGMITRTEQPFDPGTYQSSVKAKLAEIAIDGVDPALVPAAKANGAAANGVARENVLAALEAFGA